MEHSPDVDRAIRHFRLHTRGVLLADGTPWPIRFVLSPASARVVSVVHHTVPDAHELVLFCPEERVDAMQLLVFPRTVAVEDEPGRDRYLAYHGRPDQPSWVALDIEACRWDGEVFDGAEIAAALTGGCHLLADEPALLRWLNGEGDAARRLAARAGHRGGEDPMAVGIDAWGLDLRCGSHLYRVEFDQRQRDADDAQRTLERLIEGEDDA